MLCYCMKQPKHPHNESVSSVPPSIQYWADSAQEILRAAYYKHHEDKHSQNYPDPPYPEWIYHVIGQCIFSLKIYFLLKLR